MPEELWTEVHNTVQEAVIKTTPKKKKCKKARWLSEEAFHIAEKRKEAKDIKKRWQEYTEELYKKDLHDPDNHDGVITHLEPDILECNVKWALENITMNKAWRW